MRIADIIVPIKAADQLDGASVVADSREIMGFSLAEIEGLTPLILVKDAGGTTVGKVHREVLTFLRASCNSRMLEKMLFQCQEGIVAVDTEGRIFYANEAYTRILGVKKGNILGKPMAKLEPEAVMLKVFASGEAILNKTVAVKTLDRHVTVNVFPIKEDGKLIAVVSFFRDVTEARRLSQALDRARGLADYFRQQLEQQEELTGGGIIGKSPAFAKALSQMLIVAKTEAPVLLMGENGVGKEVFAKAVHANSGRADRPLITVNCAAIPENLLESELFGYEEGAFTGAKRGGKLGKFELADGGTIFLDEVGDMSAVMQAKLLRVLQEKELEKVGRTHSVKVDVRVIAATNRPLEKLVEQGLFRTDLYYRLNVVTIRIPPLRDRGEDIGLLACHFLRGLNKQYNKKLTLSPEVVKYFYDYRWPGNVRELQNGLEYSAIMCAEKEIQLEHLPPHMTEGKIDLGEPRVAGPDFGPLDRELLATERALIQRALQAAPNKSRAMELLGISRRTFYRKLKEHGLQ